MHTFGILGMVLIWLVLVLFIVALVYYKDRETEGEISAKDVLDKRFANGEINEREYKIIRDSLRL
jgi:putative membrane protein